MPNAITRALASVGLWANESPNMAADPFSWQFWGGSPEMDAAGQRVDAESVMQLDVVAAVLARLGGTISAKTVNGSITLGTRGLKGHLEASTVNIATEFTNLLVYQQGYDANSKVVTTADQMSQDVINLIQ